MLTHNRGASCLIFKRQTDQKIEHIKQSLDSTDTKTSGIWMFAW